MKTQKKIVQKKSNELMALKTPSEILNVAKQKVKLVKGIFKDDILTEKNGRIYSPYLELLFEELIKILNKIFDEQYFLDNPKEDKIRSLVADKLLQREKDPTLHTLKIIIKLKKRMEKSSQSFLYFFDISDWNGLVYQIFDFFFTDEKYFIEHIEKGTIERLTVNKSIDASVGVSNKDSNSELNEKILVLQNQSVEDKKTISKLQENVSELMVRVSFLMARENLVQTFPTPITTVGTSTHSNPIYKVQSEKNGKQEESEVNNLISVLGSGSK